MPGIKELLDKAKMPIGKQAKQELDSWINENINVPLAKRGHEDTAAALSAALSAGGELLIPDSLADAALAAVPGAKLLKSAKKGMKALKAEGKAVAGLEKAGTIDYGNIAKAEKAAADKARKQAEEKADTLLYTNRDVVRVPAKKDLYDYELRALEKSKK